ncbi:MAG: membrane protein of unknown function [Promethearchaeota archaeon]|nr:MAG: membrane protein of unknown function [Candidatus Lokiarchaeota archaeon]
MGELFSWFGLIKNSIFSVLVGMVLPYLVIPFIGQYVSFLNYGVIMIHGIIFTVVYSLLGLFKKDTLIRFLIGIGYIGLLIYFFSIGNNFFTLYLPHSAFGEIGISETIGGSKVSFGFNYSWVATTLIFLIGLSTLRKFLKPRKEKKERLSEIEPEE